ncbi:MAG: YaeQ family protein [Pseudomonadales bacterium]
MALKPTIFKYTLSVSDVDEGFYDTLNLTVAQHPSETTERMIARVLAYVLNVAEVTSAAIKATAGVELLFTAGLSTPDEPDICARSLDNQLLCWIDVGEPAFERIKKATRLTSANAIAKPVRIYSFNSKSGVWWRQEKENFASLPASVYQLQWPSIQAVAALVERTMVWSISISDATLYIAADSGSAEIPVLHLQ